MSTKNKNIVLITIAVIVVCFAVFVFWFFANKTYPDQRVLTRTVEPWMCLGDDESVSYEMKEYDPIIGNLHVSIKDKNTDKIKSELMLDNIRTNAYPVEFKKCGIYFNELFNYESNDTLEQKKGYRRELIVSDYNGRKKNLADFRNERRIFFIL